MAAHKKLVLKLIKIHSRLLAEQGLDQVKVASSENARPSTRVVGEGHWIICNAVVSVVVQSLVYHRFLDAEDPFNLLYFEAFYITEVWDTGLQVA